MRGTAMIDCCCSGKVRNNASYLFASSEHTQVDLKSFSAASVTEIAWAMLARRDDKWFIEPRFLALISVAHDLSKLHAKPLVDFVQFATLLWSTTLIQQPKNTLWISLSEHSNRTDNLATLRAGS